MNENLKHIWFTSDNHFGHARIIDLCQRPFTSVEEMDETMVSNWNSLVSPEDDVYHVGDVSLGKRSETLQIVRRLNGRKYLYIDLYESVGFMLMPDIDSIWLGGNHFKISHLPYTGDSHSDEDRYQSHRPVDEGLPLICGHVHEAWTVKDRQINVGVDVRGFKPVSAWDIVETIK
jgi:calcineurin-like phosphoesterase family protein